MRRFVHRKEAMVLGAALLVAASAAAQAPITLPEASPKASINQTVGLTEIGITYHRPAVNKRTIWGDLVPYDEVWRAGANQNTTISFSSPVTINGKPLAAGTYGLHMIPTKGDWTIAFSNTNWAWGSFSYDEKEDALRVTAKPQPAEFQERLSYSFDDPTEKSVEVALRWEKVRVPFTVEVDTPTVVTESIRHQLRDLPRFAGANALNDKAMKVATEADVNAYGYQLLGAGKTDEAIAMFQKNVKDHPQSWNTYDSLGEAYDRKGEKKLAAENYRKALSMTQDPEQKKRIEGVLKKF